MKKIIFSLLGVALILSSCGDNAQKVNGMIIQEVEQVNDVMETISQYIAGDDYDAAKSEMDSLSAQVKISVDVINKLNNKKAGAYKQSAVDYLNFIGQNGVDMFSKTIEMFRAAKIREQDDIASGKQSPTMINSGSDFDAARKILKEFRKELKEKQKILLEKQDKFNKANGIQ